MPDWEKSAFANESRKCFCLNAVAIFSGYFVVLLLVLKRPLICVFILFISEQSPDYTLWNSRNAESLCDCEWAMDTGACCVAPSAPQRSDDQIVPAHPGDCWNPHPGNHSQPFLDAWLQMQVSLRQIDSKRS